MRIHQVTRAITASPAAVWAILTDSSGYTTWDSGVTQVEGAIAPGAKIKVFSTVSPGRAFPVTVTTFEPERKMVWGSGMPLGLFKGERTFTLTPKGDGVTEFHMQEVFSGPLLPIFGRSIPDLTASFEQFADGLKARAEQPG